MTITFNEAAFLKYCKKNRDFKSTAMLGRQKLTKCDYMKKILQADNFNEFETSEDLLKKYFNSTSVDSYDASDFEGANKLHDFNLEVQEELLYETFLDLGSTEHILNPIASFKNIIKLTKVGGMIIHHLPANNALNHGFYQFSPDLFFTIYSEKNGFENTEVFLLERSWYPNYFVKVDKKKMKEIRTSEETLVYVKTVKKSHRPPFIFNESQEKYVKKWNDKELKASKETKALTLIRKLPLLYKAIKPLYRIIFYEIIPRINHFREKGINKQGEKIYIKDI